MELHKIITVLIAFAILISGCREKNAPLECESYHYSICPENCIKTCMPSNCCEPPECEPRTCTDDCDGPGSCKSTPETFIN